LYTSLSSLCKPDFLHFSAFIAMAVTCKKLAWMVS